jgi:hypothetical protein
VAYTDCRVDVLFQQILKSTNGIGATESPWSDRVTASGEPDRAHAPGSNVSEQADS